MDTGDTRDESINYVLEHKTLGGRIRGIEGRGYMYGCWSHTRGMVITVEVFFTFRDGKVQQYISWKNRMVIGRVVADLGNGSEEK